MARDKVAEKQVKAVMKNQWSDAKRNLLSNYYIKNIDKGETLLKIKKIFNNLTQNH